MSKLPVAVLMSGRGSNLAALVEASRAPDYPAEIRLVISDNPDASGLDLAAKAGITAAVVQAQGVERAAFEKAVLGELDAAGIELVCLAGFMRLLSVDFVTRWHDRLINIHPSLLPAFKGLDAHARALAAGVRISGCTVHFVRPAMDEGPIVAQAAVPVAGDDTTESLALRVREVEHRIYPLALDLVASGRAQVKDERVTIDDEPQLGTPLVVPSDLS